MERFFNEKKFHPIPNESSKNWKAVTKKLIFLDDSLPDAIPELPKNPKVFIRFSESIFN